MIDWQLTVSFCRSIFFKDDWLRSQESGALLLKRGHNIYFDQKGEAVYGLQIKLQIHCFTATNSGLLLLMTKNRFNSIYCIFWKHGNELLGIRKKLNKVVTGTICLPVHKLHTCHNYGFQTYATTIEIFSDWAEIFCVCFWICLQNDCLHFSIPSKFK